MRDQLIVVGLLAAVATAVIVDKAHVSRREAEERARRFEEYLFYHRRSNEFGHSSPPPEAYAYEHPTETTSEYYPEATTVYPYYHHSEDYHTNTRDYEPAPTAAPYPYYHRTEETRNPTEDYYAEYATSTPEYDPVVYDTTKAPYPYYHYDRATPEYYPEATTEDSRGTTTEYFYPTETHNPTDDYYAYGTTDSPRHYDDYSMDSTTWAPMPTATTDGGYPYYHHDTTTPDYYEATTQETTRNSPRATYDPYDEYMFRSTDSPRHYDDYTTQGHTPGYDSGYGSYEGSGHEESGYEAGTTEYRTTGYYNYDSSTPGYPYKKREAAAAAAEEEFEAGAPF